MASQHGQCTQANVQQWLQHELHEVAASLTMQCQQSGKPCALESAFVHLQAYVAAVSVTTANQLDLLQLVQVVNKAEVERTVQVAFAKVRFSLL